MSDYISHLARSDNPLLTLCGEPWQGWQEPVDADLAGGGRPRSPHFPAPPGVPIHLCGACRKVAIEAPPDSDPGFKQEYPAE